MRTSVTNRMNNIASCCLRTSLPTTTTTPKKLLLNWPLGCTPRNTLVSRHAVRNILTMQGGQQKHDERYVNLKFAPVEFDKNSVLVFPNFISQEEEDVLMGDIDANVSSTRYQRGHWDAVITGYRELELPHPDDNKMIHEVVVNKENLLSSQKTSPFGSTSIISAESQNIITSIRQHLLSICFNDDHHSSSSQQQQQKQRLSDVSWLPCHAIDLKSNGKLMAHVDSVRFSGDIVAGLCLGASASAAIMRLKPSIQDYSSSSSSSSRQQNKQEITGNTNIDSYDYVDLYLPSKTLYVLRDMARYHYSHELLPDLSTFDFYNRMDSSANTDSNHTNESNSNFDKITVKRDRRISVIFRDAKHPQGKDLQQQ